MVSHAGQRCPDLRRCFRASLALHRNGDGSCRRQTDDGSIDHAGRYCISSALCDDGTLAILSIQRRNVRWITRCDDDARRSTGEPLVRPNSGTDDGHRHRRKQFWQHDRDPVSLLDAQFLQAGSEAVDSFIELAIGEAGIHNSRPDGSTIDQCAVIWVLPG